VVVGSKGLQRRGFGVEKRTEGKSGEKDKRSEMARYIFHDV
jgi:hypothetical protein